MQTDFLSKLLPHDEIPTAFIPIFRFCGAPFGLCGRKKRIYLYKIPLIRTFVK